MNYTLQKNKLKHLIFTNQMMVCTAKTLAGATFTGWLLDQAGRHVKNCWALFYLRRPPVVLNAMVTTTHPALRAPVRLCLSFCYSALLLRQKEQTIHAGGSHAEQHKHKGPVLWFYNLNNAGQSVLTAQQYRSSHAAAFQQPCLFLIYIVHCLE